MSDDESIVLKPKIPLDDIILSQNKDELAKFMDQPFQAIAEVITGVLAEGPKAWGSMAGRFVQSILKDKMYQQFSREIEDLREKGKIREDYADERNKYGYQSWVEVMTAIDDDPTDADRLEALRAMFYGVNRLNATDRERVIAYQLFQIAKKLTSGNLLLLKEIYDKYKSNRWTSNHETTNASAWYLEMANLGHGLSALVEVNERALMENGLITAHTVSGQLHQVQENNARLTDLGMRFCENIETYRVARDEATSQSAAS
jgi:hypothetical protein